MNPARQFLLALAAAVVTVLFASAGAQAAELIYVHEPGCPYCRKWEAQVGSVYPSSEAGRLAPLRAIHIRDLPGAGLRLLRGVRYTPTFILVEGDAEVGRIEGYPGEDFFWGLLDRLIEKLDPPQQEPAAPVTRPTPIGLTARDGPG